MKLAGGVVLIVAGAVWILQGLDVAFAPTSFMTGDKVWVLWGSLAILGGAGLILSARGKPR